MDAPVDPQVSRARVAAHRGSLAVRSLQAWRVLRPVLLGAGIVLGAWLWLTIVRTPDSGWDAHAYWAAPLADPYANSAAGAPDAYLYSPAFRQVLAPLFALSWPAFFAVWEAGLIATVIALTGPLAVVILPIYPVPFELNAGNIHIFLAAAIVVGFRWPAAWAAVLLTKVTPGVGLLWFAVRREWRNLGIALAATAAISLVSFAFAPALWGDWIRVLLDNAAAPAPIDATLWQPPLVLRMLVAALLVIAGAASDRKWTVPIAATIALPLLAQINLVMLVGAVPLLAPDVRAFVARVQARRAVG